MRRRQRAPRQPHPELCGAPPGISHRGSHVAVTVSCPQTLELSRSHEAPPEHHPPPLLSGTYRAGRHIGRSVPDLAAAVARAPGTKLIAGPSNVRIGGLRAKHVRLVAHEDIGCDPGYFFSWRSECRGPCWVDGTVGETIKVWIVKGKGDVGRVPEVDRCFCAETVRAKAAPSRASSGAVPYRTRSQGSSCTLDAPVVLP